MHGIKSHLKPLQLVMVNTSQYVVPVHAGSNGDAYIINGEVNAHSTMVPQGTTIPFCQRK